MAAIGAAGYTYDILIGHHQLQEAILLSEKLPGQPLILDHCGKPALRSNNLKNWKAGIKELAQNPNVHCKESGLLPKTSGTIVMKSSYGSALISYLKVLVPTAFSLAATGLWFYLQEIIPSGYLS
jgi:hypothetical protein